MMTMNPVNSSNISSVGYDEETGEMRVTFAKGGTYVYAGVDQATYQNMLDSDSPGSFLHRNIRDRYLSRKE